jgi:hypothetical protein
MIDLKSPSVKIKNRQAIVNAVQYENKIRELIDVETTSEYSIRNGFNQKK